MIAFLLANWSWLAALASGPLGWVSIVAGKKLLGWALVALTAVLLIWAVVGGVRDYLGAVAAEGFAKGFTASQALNRAQVDIARARLNAARDVDVQVGRDLMDRLGGILATLDAEFRDAEEEARDAAPIDPGCAPSELSIRVWNDATTRANRAAAGADPQ